MINYQLPKFELPKLKLPKGKSFKPKKKNFSQVLISAILISSLFGFLAAMIPSIYFYKETIALLNSLNIISRSVEPTPSRLKRSAFSTTKILDICIPIYLGIF